MIKNDKNNFYIIILIFAFLLLFYSYCSNIVYADSFSYPYGPNEYSIDELETEFINGVDDSAGLTYYKSPSVARFATFATTASEPVDERKYFDEYPYWFIYEDMIYASDYQFHYNSERRLIETPVEEFGLNFEFYAFKFGSFKTGSVFAVSISDSLFEGKVRSNYDIKNDSGDVIIPKAAKDVHLNPETGQTLRWGYYTFHNVTIAKPLYFALSSESNYFLTSEINKGNAFFTYSYLGSDKISSDAYVHTPYKQYREAFGKVTEAEFLRFYVKSNYDVMYNVPGGENKYLSVLNPSLMPDSWTPTFDDTYKDPPKDGEEIPEEDEETTFLGKIIGWLNPLSPNFFLKIAFLPSDDYFPNKINSLLSQNPSFKNFFLDVSDSMNVIFNTDYIDGEFDGVEYPFGTVLKIGPYYCNSTNYEEFVSSPIFCPNEPKFTIEYDISGFKLVDASYIARFISKFKYYTSAVMNFFFMIWLIRWIVSFMGGNMPYSGYSLDPPKESTIGFRK